MCLAWIQLLLGKTINAYQNENVQVAPIGVYTSGKGSSAAGLTASVIKDPGSVSLFLIFSPHTYL